MLSKLSIIKWSELHQPQRERGKIAKTPKKRWSISHTPVSLVKMTIVSTRIKFNQFGKSNLCDSLSNDKCFFMHHQTFLTNIFSNIVLLTNIFLYSCFCLYFIFFLLFSRVFFSPKDLHTFRSHAEIYEWGKINVEIFQFWKVAVMKL